MVIWGKGWRMLGFGGGLFLFSGFVSFSVVGFVCFLNKKQQPSSCTMP